MDEDEEDVGDDEVDDGDDADNGEPEEPPEIRERRQQLLDAAAPGESADWLTYGYDYFNTGYNRHSEGPADGVEERWRFEMEEEVSGRIWRLVRDVPDPAVSGDCVFFGYHDLFCVDRESGEEVWRSELDGELTYTPEVAADLVFYSEVGSGAASTRAFDIEEESELWRSEMGSATLLRYEDLLFSSSSTGVRLFDGVTGDIVSDEVALTGRSNKGMAVYDSTLISIDGSTSSFDINGWEVNWLGDPIRGMTKGAPAIDTSEKVIYVAGREYVVHALDFETGEDVWRWRPEIWGEQLEENVGSDGVDGDEGEGEEGSNGSVDRSRPPPGRNFSPCVHEDVVVVGDDDLYAVDRSSGEHVWTTREVASPHQMSPTASQNTIYTTRKDQVYALDVDTGEIRWSYELPARAVTDPVVAGEEIFVADADSTLYCLG